MLCEVVDEITEVIENEVESQEESTSTVTPEKGRVWRWRNHTTGTRKNTEGPVLRATVKPVKRFIPEVNTAVSAPITPQSQSVSIQRTVPTSNLEETPSSDIKTKRQQTANPQSVQSSNVKKKRVREQWSIEDKNHFFDAVAVHGKDFDAIQKTIALRHKKRGDDSVIKTKDQVRHLYYRTWTTISKRLDHEISTNNSVKGSQELLAVINYGELRKKLGGCLFKKKGILKLNELITYGSTSIRVKGKNYRIKTPSCKALKKIHDREDAAKKSNIVETRRIKLPLQVKLEMHPLSMHAWNQVHALAHNPRVKFIVPLDCQLSYILLYLNNKWKTLSEKMFQGSSVHPPTANQLPHNGANKIEIHIPPESSVKAKFKIHEIISTKTHNIVSYEMLKTGKFNGSKKKKKILEDPGSNPINHNEVCNSSEDESAFVDRLSDVEEQQYENKRSTAIIKHSNSTIDAESLPATSSLTCNHSFTEALDSLDQENEKQTFDSVDYEVKSKTLDSSDHENDSKVVDSFCQETDISSGHGDDIIDERTDSNDSTSCDINELICDVIEPTCDVNEPSHDINKPSCDVNEPSHDINKPSCIVSKLSCDINKASNHVKKPSNQINIFLENNVASTNSLEIANCSLALNHSNGNDAHHSMAIGSPTHVIINDVENNTDLEQTADTDVNRGTCVEDAESPIKLSSPSTIQRSWDRSNADGVTLAEIYLMLGKPTLFKLCYEWKRKDEADVPKLDKNSKRLSPGIKALVQCAALLLNKLNKASDNNKAAKDNKDSEMHFESECVDVGVQCSLTDENESASNEKIYPTFESNKKLSNKGMKKKQQNLTSMKCNNNFAVPKVPRKKRNQSLIATKTGLLNAEGIPRGGQVQLSDVEFRKQMDALNRRMDLFRTHSKNRTSRKPFIVQRSMIPNARSVRKMMTLSIDSLGLNRTGLSNDLLTAKGSIDPPELESVGATISSVATNNLSSSKSSNTPWISDKGKALGIVISRLKSKVDPSSSNNSCVLTQAVEESGLFSNDAIDRKNCVNLEESVAESLLPKESSFAPAHSLLSTNTGSTETSKNSLLDDSSISLDSTLITNDVVLPTRPPSPSTDSISDILNFGTSTSNSSLINKVDGRQSPLLSIPVLDLPLTPRKPSSSPLHPWSINCNSRDGLGGFATLDTPQRILSSDTEDSMDSSIFNPKRARLSAANDVASTSSYVDEESEMRSLLNENSVDFISKFQELIRTSTEDTKGGGLDKVDGG